jgi:hypothetical protein
MNASKGNRREFMVNLGDESSGMKFVMPWKSRGATKF